MSELTDFIEKECPFCDKGGTVELLHNNTAEFEGKEGIPPYTVEGLTSYHCTACDQKWVTMEQNEKDHHLFIEARRRAEKLLSGEEIKAILQKLPYSQKELEMALGLGKNTFSKWTNNTICQSRSKDALLLAISKTPELIDEIAQRRGITLTGQRKGRPSRKVAS